MAGRENKRKGGGKERKRKGRVERREVFKKRKTGRGEVLLRAGRDRKTGKWRGKETRKEMERKEARKDRRRRKAKGVKRQEDSAEGPPSYRLCPES